jgi:SAM-dependent methyltransferase
MTSRGADASLETYDAPEVVAHYAALEYLTACERLLFEAYIPAGSAILDLGVGGGRTTSFLARRASRYVGADNAPAMIRACQAKFPGLEFVVANASDLAGFPNGSFDAVVFGFNGIDYVLPEPSRRNCFEQVHRLLKSGGVMIFSSHNARAVMVRPNWSQERLRRIARRCSAEQRLLYGSFLAILTSARFLLACAQSARMTMPRLLKRIPSATFWRGQGTLVDSAHGGLLTYYSTPARVTAELAAVHFRPERVLGDDFPQTSHAYATDWYYYVFRKPCEK